MTNENARLTPIGLLSAASELLDSGGYQRIENDDDRNWPTKNVRLFENTYSIVAVLVFDTWRELSDTWIDAQTTLTELISKHVPSWEAKAWDGYLVLLTLALVDASEALQPSQIRYNTHRVRKILATGEELKRLPDVERAMSPLLPIMDSGNSVNEITSPLDLLPSLLSESGIPEEVVKVVVDSYLKGQSLMDQLNTYRVQHENR